MTAEDLAHELWAMAQGRGPVEDVTALMADRIRSYGSRPQEPGATMSTPPTVERIGTAIEVLQWMSENASQHQDDPSVEGVSMRLHLTIAALYLVALQKHIVMDGMEPVDALQAAARGEMRIGGRDDPNA